MNETLRLFVALAIPRVVMEALGLLREELGAGLGALRWIRPEGVHLTLKFLGDVPGSRLEAIRGALAGCSGTDGPFRLETEGVGVFPHMRSPRVLWIGFRQPPDSLYHLQQRVELAMEGQGFPGEQRAFRPHLTVGRFRRQLRRNERELLASRTAGHQERGFGGFTVSRLSLYSSVLLPSGARYEEVDGWPLSRTGPLDEVN